jgi:hypothetical protein
MHIVYIILLVSVSFSIEHTPITFAFEEFGGKSIEWLPIRDLSTRPKEIKSFSQNSALGGAISSVHGWHPFFSHP